KAGDVGMAHFFRGLALENLQRWKEAADAFAASAKGGYDPKNSELHRSGALRRAGDPPGARSILSKLSNLEGSSAEYHYQKGSLLAGEGELTEAASEFEKATSLDREHTGALFELAYINDLYGNDDAAADYYRQCLRRPPVPLAALINLGILYEDENQFRKA